MKAFLVIGLLVIFILGFPFSAPFFLITGIYEMIKNK